MRRSYPHDVAKIQTTSTNQYAQGEVPGTFNQVEQMSKEIAEHKSEIDALKSELLDLYRQVSSRRY